jgi:hypothetical protein
MFGETLEWLGAEHLLAQRAASPQIAQELRAAVQRREQLARSNGLDLLGVSSYYQAVIKGVIIVGAVVLDQFRQRRSGRGK